MRLQFELTFCSEIDARAWSMLGNVMFVYSLFRGIIRRVMTYGQLSLVASTSQRPCAAFVVDLSTHLCINHPPSFEFFFE